MFIYFSIFAPNIWFYKNKYRDNRLEFHKIFIHYYLKNNESFTGKNNININLNNNNINSEKRSTLLDENENEIEKFIQDYCNLVSKGDFRNLKI
jgi:hypothetical protein